MDRNESAEKAAELAAASAAVGRLSALGGLDLAIGWRWRFSRSEAAPPPLFDILDAAAARVALPGMVRRDRLDGKSYAALHWSTEGGSAAPPFPGRTTAPFSGMEAGAAAVRLCDGVGMRLGVGRAAVAPILGPDRTTLLGARLLLARHEGGGGSGGWVSGGGVSRGWTQGGRREATAVPADGPLVQWLDDAEPALIACPEDGRLTVWLPATDDAGAYAEAVYAVAVTAAALGVAVRLDGPCPPDDPRARALRLRAEGSCLTLDIAPGAAPGPLDAPASEVLVELKARGWRASAVDVSAGDSAGGARLMAARLDAAARAAAFWHEWPGLALTLGARASGDAAPSTASALDDALGAACAPGPDLLSRRRHALSEALRFGAIRLDADGRLVLVDLAPPESAVSAAALSLLLGAVVARSAVARDVARTPVGLVHPADAYGSPDLAWADFAAALSDLAADGVALSAGWFQPDFERRTPILAQEALGELRLTLRRAAQTGPDHGRLSLLAEGAEPPVLVNGRAAPWSRAPGAGGLIVMLRWRRDDPPLLTRIDLRGASGRRARLSAILEIDGERVALRRTQTENWPDAPDPWPVSSFAPKTLDLRPAP